MFTIGFDPEFFLLSKANKLALFATIHLWKLK